MSGRPAIRTNFGDIPIVYDPRLPPNEFQFVPSHRVRDWADYTATVAAARIEAELRRLLGFWVSELTPTMIMARDGRFIGLGAEELQRLGEVARVALWAWQDDPTGPPKWRAALPFKSSHPAEWWMSSTPYPSEELVPWPKEWQ